MTNSVRKSRRRFAIAAVLALLGTAVLMVAGAGSASAAPATRYVATDGGDTTNDCTDATAPCRTIQHAVDQADQGDTVSVGSGVYDEAVRIRKSLTVHGAGATGSDRTTVDGPTECCAPSIFIDGVDTSSVPEVTIEDIDVSGNDGDVGILIDEAIVHVNSSVVANNDEEGVLLGEFRDAVQPQAKPGDVEAVVPALTVSNSAVTGNGGHENAAGILVNQGRADVDHSAINNNGQGGVVIEGEATVNINTSTLDANVGAAFVVDDSAAIGSFTDSTASNTGPFSGDEGPAFGGGLLVFSGGTLNVETSTIANNTGQGVLSEHGYVHVDNSTISGTKPAVDDAEAGGVVVDNVVPELQGKAATKRFGGRGADNATAGVSPKAAVQFGTALRATIVADNTTIDDCNGPVDDAGYNLASDDSCGFGATGSIENGHAKLGALADNGGPTSTMMPKKGSDALDQIPSGEAGCGADDTDQRGEPRLAGPKCDIGAVEVAQTPVVISPDALPHGTVGKTYHEVISATGGMGAPYEWSLASGALPPGLTFSSAGVIGGVPTQAGTFHFTVSVDDPTLKDYTIVIAAAAAAGEPPLANTGPNVRPYAYLGATAVGLGILMLFTSGALGRWYRRYIRQH